MAPICKKSNQQDNVLPGDPIYYPNLESCMRSLSIGIPDFNKAPLRKDIVDQKPFQIPDSYDSDSIARAANLQSKYKKK